MLFRFEPRESPLLPRPAFLRRLLLSAFAGLALVLFSLAIGMFGYHGFEQLDWTDAFLNASMLLSGMGPLWSPRTEAGKLFAGLYALYSGLTVIVFAGITFAPVVHRFLHAFHADDDDGKPGD